MLRAEIVPGSLKRAIDTTFRSNGRFSDRRAVSVPANSEGCREWRASCPRLFDSFMLIALVIHCAEVFSAIRIRVGHPPHGADPPEHWLPAVDPDTPDRCTARGRSSQLDATRGNGWKSSLFRNPQLNNSAILLSIFTRAARRLRDMEDLLLRWCFERGESRTTHDATLHGFRLFQSHTLFRSEKFMYAVAHMPLIFAAIQYSLLYMLGGGGIVGAAVIYGVAKAMKK
jgi:hypothetical protein